MEIPAYLLYCHCGSQMCCVSSLDNLFLISFVNVIAMWSKMAFFIPCVNEFNSWPCVLLKCDWPAHLGMPYNELTG